MEKEGNIDDEETGKSICNSSVANNDSSTATETDCWNFSSGGFTVLDAKEEYDENLQKMSSMAVSSGNYTVDDDISFQKVKLDEENIEKELSKVFKSPKNSKEIGNTVSELHKCVEEEVEEDIFSKLAKVCQCSKKIAENVPVAESVAKTLGTITSIFQIVGDQMRVNAEKIQEDETYAPFERFQDSEITSEACGLEDLFYTTHAYLKGIHNQANDEEIKTLQDRVPIYKGVEFLGKLKAKIENLMTKQDIKSVSRAVAYIDLYSRLAILRTLVLWQLYAIKKRSNIDHASTSGVYAVIKEADKTDCEMVEYITKSSFEKAVFLTIFNPTELRHFQHFLSVKSINPIRLDENDTFCSKMHLIRPAKWPEWHIKFGWDRQGSIWGEKNLRKRACKFLFEPVKEREIDNIFHIRSVKYPTYYMIMESGKLGYCGSVEGLPGPEGKWKIIRFIEDKLPYYVMSPMSRPCFFIYMTSSPTGHVRGAYDLQEIRSKGVWQVIDVDSER
ncbi:uncharacterized protein LOC133186282 [Saccostrea echinata]|uniref:uncharacterized protein LOC133186282 n=1 Tax=Saccostrea echinata TaxID=191078 RepID=UPI002A80B17A|nr:uncharacterized protein LOC133186282 [Saccostrea echinata]